MDLNKINILSEAEYNTITTPNLDELYFVQQNGNENRLLSTHNSGFNWYKIFEETQNDGTKKYWCEQGGRLATTGTQTLTFLVPYVDTQYAVFFQHFHSVAVDVSREAMIHTNFLTTSSLQCYVNTSSDGAYWRAYGYCNKPD